MGTTEVKKVREVVIYRSTGNLKKFSTSVLTWGELQKELDREGISYDNMSAILGGSKHALVTPESTLPNENFAVFLMPKKTKSGAATKKAPVKKKVATKKASSGGTKAKAKTKSTTSKSTAKPTPVKTTKVVKQEEFIVDKKQLANEANYLRNNVEGLR
jgi:hypothetical protein